MVRFVGSTCILWLCVGCAAIAQQRSPDEQSLLAADARRLTAFAAADASAIDSISHPNLRLNAPNGRVVTKPDFVQAAGSGQIRNEIAERIPESVTITGNIGVVMGRETGQSGAAPVNRRYTNVYLRENGVWRLLARRANVVAE